MGVERNGGARGARLRRRRGYDWEETIVKRFRGAGGWKAFRLGSPSTGLPDVLAVSTADDSIFTIEAKSGSGTSLYVPADQIVRCVEWIETFDRYKRRDVLLAFKFLSKKRISSGRYEGRQLREYYKVWDRGRRAQDCVCTYDGQVYARSGGARREISLKECEMPFETRHSPQNGEMV